MQGMNEKTGKYLSDVEYLKQSIKTIITTRIRSRVMRRNFGSNVFNRIDNPISRLKIINDLINIHKLLQTYSCLGWHGVFLLMFGMKLGP